MIQVSPGYIPLVKNGSAVDPSLLPHCLPHGWGLVCDFLCLVVLNQGQLCLPGAFLIVTLGVGTTRIEPVEARETAEHSPVTGQPYTMKTSHHKTSAGLRLRNAGLG